MLILSFILIIFISGCQCPEIEDELGKELGEKYFMNLDCFYDNLRVVSKSGGENIYGVTVCNINQPCKYSEYFTDDYRNMEEICFGFQINKTSNDYVKGEDNLLEGAGFRSCNKPLIGDVEIDEISYKGINIKLK